MKLQNLGRIIGISFLASILFLVPLALFAAIQQYQNPLCGSINSLPQFIKGVLTIVVKVGIPIATIFIVWSGFLFLTAQGDETKLTKAKHSFVWACIGTAVLLGAWLLATAINATIQSIGGGTNRTPGSTVNGGCAGGSNPELPPGNLAGAFFWPNPVPFTQTELLNLEKTSKISKDGLTECTDFYDLLFLDEAQSNTVSGNTIISVGDASTLRCSYDTGIVSIQSNLNALPEQAFLYVEYKDGTSEWIHAGVGTNDSIPSPTALLESLSKNSQVSAVYDMHTHPYQSQADTNTKYSLPSLQDLIMAYREASIYPPIFTQKVIDTDIVWIYKIDSVTPIHNALLDIANKTKAFMQSSPLAQKAWNDIYSKTSNNGQILTDKAGISTYTGALCTAVMRAGAGDFGATEQKKATVLINDIFDSTLMKYKIAGISSLGWSMGDFQKNEGDALKAASDLGVVLATEMHPYSWCKQ